jgi:hypothetical protein
MQLEPGLDVEMPCAQPTFLCLPPSPLAQVTMVIESQYPLGLYNTLNELNR